MPVIKDWIQDASSQLASLGIKSAHLDAEILLSRAMGRNRTFLHAYPEYKISIEELTLANGDLKLRSQRIPIAYITGAKEFYGRNFTVSAHTLVPRPESELVIDTLLVALGEAEQADSEPLKLVDVGTGTGCLGITAKLEIQNIDVTLVDIDRKAIEVAARNAKDLAADVKTIESDLLCKLTGKFDYIIANLPYVDRSWDRSAETNHEPKHALFADDFGKSVIIKLIKQTPERLKVSGYLIIEADPRQHDSIIATALNNSLELISRQGYVLAFRRVQV